MSYNSIYDIIGLHNEVNRLETQAKLGWDKEFRTLKNEVVFDTTSENKEA